jgi:hypothetical protein
VFVRSIDRLQSVPGVASVTAIGGSTPTRVGLSMPIAVPGRDSTRIPPNGGVFFSVVDDRFLTTAGMRVRRGRAFSEVDVRARSRVALVNQAMADFYWPGENPLGKCVRLRGENVCTEIVGVVQRMILFRVINEPSYAQIFIPPSHPVAGNRQRTLLVRASGELPAVAAQVRVTLQQIAPTVPYISVRTFADLVAPQMRPWRLGAAMFSLFGALALLIASVGLYSVMAFWVAQRRFELGVRIALGARGRDVQRLVFGDTVRTLGGGLAIGFIIAAVAAPRVSSLLFETSPHDPIVYGGVFLLLALAAIAAAVIPARRSMAVDPATSFRADG